MSSTPVRDIPWRPGCGVALDWAGALAALLVALGIHMGANLLYE